MKRIVFIIILILGSIVCGCVKTEKIEKPIIVLKGDSNISITEGSIYVDEGAYVNGIAEAKLLTTIWHDGKLVSKLDTNVIATYTIKYNFSLDDGTKADEVIRKVNVLSIRFGVLRGEYVVSSTTGKGIALVIEGKLQNDWENIKSIYVDPSPIYHALGKVYLNDDGIAGDIRLNDKFYSGQIYIPFYMEGENIRYKLPVTVESQSGEKLVYEMSLNLSNPKYITPITPDQLRQKIEPYLAPSKLLVFDGRTSEGCTSDMEIEIVGGLNEWAGGADWKMKQISDKMWIKLVYPKIGSYEFKYRKYGEWGYNWGENGVKDGMNVTITVSAIDINITKLIIFDGRNAEGCTTDTAIEISGTINGTTGNQKMTQIADKVWVYYAYLRVGDYNYKFVDSKDSTKTWNQNGVLNGEVSIVTVKESDVNPSQLLVFDGKNAENCTENMDIELSGDFNDWGGGDEWKMTNVGNKKWIYFGHIPAGIHYYKYQKIGNKTVWWNESGEYNGEKSYLIIQ